MNPPAMNGPRVFLLVPLLFACGGSSPPSARPLTAEPLSVEDRPYFEEGVDFILDPEALEGRWALEWRQELEERVARADVIAIVRVHTLSTQTDLQRRVSFYFRVDEERRLLSEFPTDAALSSREGSLGYNTLVGNERRILQQQFVLFVKWDQPEGATSVVPRWHMSPAAAGVVERVQRLVNARLGREESTGRTRVIVREN